jgi:hypothetical protein
VGSKGKQQSSQQQRRKSKQRLERSQQLPGKLRKRQENARKSQVVQRRMEGAERRRQAAEKAARKCLQERSGQVLLYCPYTVLTLLLYSCSTVLALFLHCCHILVTLLLAAREKAARARENPASQSEKAEIFKQAAIAAMMAAEQAESGEQTAYAGEQTREQPREQTQTKQPVPVVQQPAVMVQQPALVVQQPPVVVEAVVAIAVAEEPTPEQEEESAEVEAQAVRYAQEEVAGKWGPNAEFEYLPDHTIFEVMGAYDFEAQGQSDMPQLPFKEADVMTVVGRLPETDKWWLARHGRVGDSESSRGAWGIVPAGGYVCRILGEVEALYDFEGDPQTSTLGFHMGQKIKVLSEENEGWHRGGVVGVAVGLFPANYTTAVPHG